MPPPAIRRAAIHPRAASSPAVPPVTASSPVAPPAFVRAHHRPEMSALPARSPKFQTSARTLTKSTPQLIGFSIQQDIANPWISSKLRCTDRIALHLPKALPFADLTQLFCVSCALSNGAFAERRAPLSSRSCTTTSNPCTHG